MATAAPLTQTRLTLGSRSVRGLRPSACARRAPKTSCLAKPHSAAGKERAASALSLKAERHALASSQSTLTERLFAAGDVEASLSLAAVTIGLGLVVAASSCGAADAYDLSMSAGVPIHHPVAADLNQIAAQEDFWVNLTRYFRFFISLMTGTAYVILKPFASLLKRPTTAVLLVAGVIGAIFFLNFTINAMLGLSDPVDYQFSPIN